MKKFTKKMLIITGVVASLSGTIFAGAWGYNSYLEKQNKNQIAMFKKEKEEIEKKNEAEMEQISYTPLQTYEREKIYNYKSVDFSEYTVPTTLFNFNNEYLNPFRVRDESVYKNFQRNKHIYVYIDENLSENEKEMVFSAVSYLNTVFNFINSEYSVTITNELKDSNAYIHLKNDPNIVSSPFGTGTILGATEIYEADGEIFNKPVVIRIQTDNITKLYGENRYDRYYKSTFMHEFLHAIGLDHVNNHYNEDYLYTPIMSPSNGGNDFLAIPELAELFGWLNEERYAKAEQDGTLQKEYNRDFSNYLYLIKYGLDQSIINKNYTPIGNLEDKQIVQVQYDETPDDGIDNKTTLTFNYPYINFCEKITPKSDGSVEKSVRPFISAKNNLIILNEDCKHFDEKEIKWSSKEGSYDYKTELTHDEVLEEIKTMEARNGYEISLVFGCKPIHYEYETQNLWQRLTHTSTKNDIKVSSALYKISYLYTWKIGKFGAEETTNNFNKSLLKNYSISYMGDDYAKN